MQVESSATPLLTVDEVEKVQRQRVASLIGHVFQLTYAATVDKLIQNWKKGPIRIRKHTDFRSKI